MLKKRKLSGCAKLGFAFLFVLLCMCGAGILAIGSYVEGWTHTLFVSLIPTFPGKVVDDHTDYDFIGGFAERTVRVRPADPTAVFAFYKQVLSSGNYVLKDARLYYEDSERLNYCLAFQFSLFGGLVQRSGSLEIFGRKTLGGLPDPETGANINVWSEVDRSVAEIPCQETIRSEGTQPTLDSTTNPVQSVNRRFNFPNGGVYLYEQENLPQLLKTPTKSALLSRTQVLS